MANFPNKAFSGIALSNALERQRKTIPYFATKERLNLRLKPNDEDLFIYDWEENRYYFIRFRSGQTQFDPIAVLSDITGGATRTETAFALQTTVMINHNSGYKPDVIIIDGLGYEFDGSVQHLNNNQLVVVFNQAESGIIITS